MSAMLRSTAGLVFCLAVCAVMPAQPPQPAALSHKQEIQRRVRTMARELVAGILDVQLRQLEENGLESLDLYGDIRTMREHVDELIDAEMPEVVALLSRLEVEPAGQREPTFLLARQKSREVLVRLLVERQALLRRLRMAEMVAQVKRLIELETGVLETTESLPERVQRERESLALATIEDQRDVKALYLGLEEMLRDAGTWAGPVGAEASIGLRRLETARVDAEIDSARSHLEDTRFADAATSLEAVIRGLRTLLESIERAQGLVAGDVQGARDAIRQLADQQQRIRQATGQPDLNRAAMDELAAQQSEIRNELAGLREELEPSSAAQGPLDQAEIAAYEATADLFEGRPEEATADQEQVLEKLAEAARQVERTDQSPIANLTAEQHDRLIEDLEGARDDLQKIGKEQEVASQAAQAKPAEARQQEERVADMLADVPEGRRLPAEVTSRLSEAEEAVTDAAAQMDRPEEQRRGATNRAEQAIERAASEVETALADARRQRLGVEIAELAQAARALDQAAAAERQIARESGQAAEAEGLRTEEAEAIGQRQADVADVAAKVGEGVRQSAPEAARVLSEASVPLHEVGENLQEAAEQPGPASKPAAREASRNAEQAAEQLARAADEIRREIGRSAEELAALIGEQLDEASGARQSVENAIENRPESMAERLGRLAQAEQKVDEAAAEQQRAAGRPEAAQAMELAAGIRQAIQLQDHADRAAEGPGDRPDAGPLDAIARQQEVAQAAERLADRAAAERGTSEADAAADQSQDPNEEPADSPNDPNEQNEQAGQAEPPDALTDALQRAEEAARHAAQDVLDAKPADAEAARAETREALQQALELAAAEADRESKAPSGEPDPAAQARVGEMVAEAHELAQPDAPQAVQTLTEAGEGSQQAEEQLRRDDSAAEPQQATADLLEQAAGQLAEAKQRLAEQAGTQLAGQSQEAGRLTDRAIPVDPAATADLQAAENHAGQGAAEVPEAPRQAGPVEQNVEAAMDQAVADLLAREQELAGDKSLAEALADLATRQQEAADQLVEADQAQPEPGEPSPPTPLAAALAEAWQQLTQVQQATVRAAQQVAGGNRTASQAIEQATALAAQMAEPPGQEGSPSQVGGAVQQGGFVENPPPQPGAVQPADEPPEGVAGTPDSPDQAAEADRRRFVEEPWLLELPPEVRAAIRANVQRRPPRGYEERLQRYFKNID